MDKFTDLCRGATDPLPALEELKKLLATEIEKTGFTAALGMHGNAQISHFLEKSIAEEEDLKSLSNTEDALEYLFGKEHLEQTRNVMEYLRRLSIVQTNPYLQIEAVAAKLLYELNT